MAGPCAVTCPWAVISRTSLKKKREAVLRALSPHHYPHPIWAGRGDEEPGILREDYRILGQIPGIESVRGTRGTVPEDEVIAPPD